jgi:hypothetical protein
MCDFCCGRDDAPRCVAAVNRFEERPKRCVGMVLFLIPNIRHDATQRLIAERNHAIFRLPCESLATCPKYCVVDSMTRFALHFLHEFRNRNTRRNGHDGMQVVGHDSERVNWSAYFSATRLHRSQDQIFDLRINDRLTLLRRPHEVVEQSPKRQLTPRFSFLAASQPPLASERLRELSPWFQPGDHGRANANPSRTAAQTCTSPRRLC